MPDKTLICIDCQRGFQFTEKESAFFKQKGFADPKRCLECRRAKKKRHEEKAGLPTEGDGD